VYRKDTYSYCIRLAVRTNLCGDGIGLISHVDDSRAGVKDLADQASGLEGIITAEFDKIAYSVKITTSLALNPTEVLIHY